MKFIDVLHRSAVVGLFGVTIYGGGFIAVRLMDVRRKARELKEYAEQKGVSYEDAALQLGYKIQENQS
ncbi:hypothetical protein GUITHDRAFT_152138 [Guillardia theta CCMP2712]|uniref:Uncharacterized protein n=1 Tax=Guillardia theta (strain CCMP2712) TaxID=905079 RepID=L1JFW9_GUITC|nr:hypothetical protein GUITHDRAFT_152138 [Guillardia theta CCMP2712]EKX47039.1 hypothetical protein GUITHDRAFT_152138 [Guillardia theta CCMP2712]|eukprot:XP_005834019.1 hypothetical protein GUITHDRAFT_152138 [Guillardia theta CCMP2712]